MLYDHLRAALADGGWGVDGEHHWKGFLELLYRRKDEKSNSCIPLESMLFHQLFAFVDSSIDLYMMIDSFCHSLWAGVSCFFNAHLKTQFRRFAFFRFLPLQGGVEPSMPPPFLRSHFRVRPQTLRTRTLQASQVRFMVDGERIAADDTAEKLGLEDEDGARWR